MRYEQQLLFCVNHATSIEATCIHLNSVQSKSNIVKVVLLLGRSVVLHASPPGVIWGYLYFTSRESG